METRKDVAAAKKVSGKYNCTQSVVTSYPDITGLDESVAMSMTDGFAAGMTNMEGTCGALVGAALVLGLANKDKRKTMSQVREVMSRFQERNHAIQCKLLKGVTTHKVLRECPFCVADACEFLEEQLDKQ
jgi:C_GCAxxG_C_C family probable redox protein